MTMIKKYLLIILCAVFLSGITIQAAENTEFHVDNQTGKAGDIVNVPVEFNTGQEVGGFQISIYYDSEVMEFQNLEKGDLILEEGQGIFDYNHIPETSEIIVVYVVADTVKDEGVIVNLQFKLKQDCGEQLPVGMGIDELIDNTEANTQITGEVSGVDEAFQAKMVEQPGNNTIVKSEEANQELEDSQTGEPVSQGEEQSRDETGGGEADDNNNPEIREDKTNQDQDEEETKEEARGTEILIAVIAAGVITVGGAIIYVIRERKKRR